MKFGQLIEYYLRSIFLEKSYTKWGGEISPKPCSKKSKLSVSLDHYSVCLYVMRYWAICVLQLLLNQLDVISFEISLTFLFHLFIYLFIYLFICLFVYLFIYLFIYLLLIYFLFSIYLTLARKICN